MKLRMTFEMRQGDREWVGRTNEGEFVTLAQAQVWVEGQAKALNESASNDGPEVDMVTIYEIGDFADEEGESKDNRVLCWFSPTHNLWDHVGNGLSIGQEP